jgi:hypothetical protein
MMDFGMLWHDDDKKTTLEQKVARARDYYTDKYGVPPTACCVHTTAADGQPGLVAGLRLVGRGNVIKDHFWIWHEAPDTRVLP